MMLGKLVSATARPLNAAGGVTAVLVSLFGVMSAFNVGLSPEQESAVMIFVAVAGQWVIGITSSNTLRRIIGDPSIPSVEPGASVPPHVPSPVATADQGEVSPPRPSHPNFP